MPQMSAVEEDAPSDVISEDIETAVKTSVGELGLTAGDAFNSRVVQLAHLNRAHGSVSFSAMHYNVMKNSGSFA